MFNKLSSLGYGLVTFAIIIGIGTLVLTKFGDGVAVCGTGYEYNTSQQYCQNATNYSQYTDPTNSGWVNNEYLTGQLGSTGLAGWTPAIIALSVGMLFLGAFLTKKNRSL